MKNYQILLVEPDNLLAKIYKDHLEKFNYKVRTCAGVQKAINEMDIVRPDLIVLEMKQSAHNGFEFLYELRSYSDWQDIPLIIHSMLPEADLSMNEDIKNELGIISYLYKPTTSLGKLHYELNRHFLVTI
jgi:DNA-binding response OmpR family regulator